MRKELLLTLALLFISSSFAKFDENLAIDLVYVSGLAYCEADNIYAGKCHKATEETEARGIEVVHAMDNGLGLNGITMAILKNEKQKTLYVAFSGTRDPVQLITEVAEAFPVSYKIHPEVEGALVFDYFYKHYLDGFRDEFNTNMPDILEEFNDYSIIFTGHSLGGAMTLHACADFMLNGWGQNRKVSVYTFGQPRISNSALIDSFVGDISEFYRLDHNKDIVAHIPPCITDLHHGCIKEGSLGFYPYHASQEVWYNSDFSSYTLCSKINGEDPECSDKEINDSVDDHIKYFGIHIGGLPKAPAETLLKSE